MHNLNNNRLVIYYIVALGTKVALKKAVRGTVARLLPERSRRGAEAPNYKTKPTKNPTLRAEPLCRDTEIASRREADIIR